MEAFLASQHRIVLKDNTVLSEEQTLESPTDNYQEKSEPVIDAYQPTPFFDDADDQEEESNENEELQPADNEFTEQLSKDTIDDILDDIDSALNDTFFDDFKNDDNSGLTEDVEDEQEVELEDVLENEQKDESNDDIDNEKSEEVIEEPQEEDSVLIFSPWDDLVTIKEDSNQDDPEADDSWQEAAQESNDESETNETKEHLFMPWQDETTAHEEPEELPENDIADNDFAEFEKDQTDTQSPEPSEKTDRASYNAFLNPFGYSIKQVTAEHSLPAQNLVDSPNLNPETVTENFDGQEEDALAVDDTEPMSVSTNEQGEPDFAAQNTFHAPPTESEIPTLVPDVVATETIPASMNTRAIAWFQSLRKSITRQNDEPGDFSGNDNKAMIHSHLANLNDEDSLEPVDGEKLASIEQAPVELLNIRGKMKHWKAAGLVLTCLILLSALAGQYLIFNLDTLVNDNRFDAVTSLTCQFTDCPDNTVIDLSNLITEELVVRSHPSATNALLVDFIFSNESSSEQLFPLAELNFTNIGGEIIANRVFDRTEYLPPEMQLFTHMPAHSSIQVSLELADPGDDATGYALVFRNP
jgi:hypothetical protein